jgi:DNA polymerase family B
MSNPVVLHQHAEARALEWESYFPGECRAWYRGHCPGPVAHFDVNSLYPSVMLGNAYPTELIDYMLTPRPGMVDWLISKYLCIARVDLEATSDDLPFRKRPRVYYPIGRFTTTLAGPEFVRAWSGGHVRSVRALAYYKRAPVFNSYVSFWWAQRQSARAHGDCAREKLAKTLLNSLYGKFAQRNPRWQFDRRIEVVRPWRAFPWKHPDTGTVYPARGIGWEGQYAADRGDSPHCFPAVAAFVGAYARERMREIRRNVPPSCLYYQDTDSLMVADDPLARAEMGPLPLGDELGELREVGRYNRVTIRGPKNYTCDGIHTIAGVKASDREVGPMEWIGERWENGPQIVVREPDRTVCSWPMNFSTPGTCLEGGYGADGWYYPIQID